MTDRQRPAWLTVAPEPEQLVEHTAVCSVDGEPFPCTHVRQQRAQAQQRNYLDSLCWWCGKPAKSDSATPPSCPTAHAATLAWCGPAKHRRCNTVGRLHYEANRLIWTPTGA